MIEGLHITDRILGLDLSTACVGAALLKGREHLTAHKKMVGELPERLHKFRPWLIAVVEKARPAVICIEAPIVGKGASTLPLAMLHGVAQEALATYSGLGPIPIHIGTWKKQVLGTGGISKEQKLNGLIVRSLTGMGFAVNHIDEADALAVALCFRKQHFGKLKID